MGLLPDEKTSVNDVEFFKIDEDGYHAKDNSWGTDALIANNNTRTVTIPSDIKPGMYVVRHEIIGLHFAWTENAAKNTSGAQPYPSCLSKWLSVSNETVLLTFFSRGASPRNRKRYSTRCKIPRHIQLARPWSSGQHSLPRQELRKFFNHNDILAAFLLS
jgi:hypothetical protein